MADNIIIGDGISTTRQFRRTTETNNVHVPHTKVDHPGEWETVAASQTTQTIGATGAAGDFLSHIVVIPATTSPGVVTVLDNATTFFSFPGGASSLASLQPFTIDIRAYSVSGAWKITTGANVSVVAVGDFT